MTAGPRRAVRVEGVRETTTGLRRMADRIDDPRPGREGAERVADRARDLAPAQSGRLRESIRVDQTETGADVIAGGPDVPYAGVQEYGWPARNIPAQPYMGPARDDMDDRVRDAYADHVAANVRRFGAEVR